MAVSLSNISVFQVESRLSKQMRTDTNVVAAPFIEASCSFVFVCTRSLDLNRA